MEHPQNQDEDFKDDTEPHVWYKKTNEIEPSELQKLSKFIKLGKNTIEFSVQGKDSCIKSCIYCWSSTDKVIISDVDGTVTKTDARGHLLTRVGFDYAHDGIASLFTRIRDNGYKIMYLSARNVGMHLDTKRYL